MTNETLKSDERIIYLYRITNQINGKNYIGQSVDPTSRWRGHRRDSVDPKVPMQFALKKYGVHNFEFIIIASCKGQDNANELETLLVAQYDSFVSNGKGYNATHGGFNAPKSEEWKQVISEKAQARAPETSEQMKAIAASRSEEYYDYMKDNKYAEGTIHTDEWKKMISNREHTEEEKSKRSESLKAAYANGTRVSAQLGKSAHNKGKKGPPAPNKMQWTDEQIEAIKIDTRSSYQIAKDWGVGAHMIQKLRKQLGIVVARGNTGQTHSEETRQLISQNRVGKCVGEDNGFFGKTHTEETKELNRQAHLKN